MKQLVRVVLTRVAPPLIASALFVGLWAVVIQLFQVKSFLAPMPGDVWRVLVRERGLHR